MADADSRLKSLAKLALETLESIARSAKASLQTAGGPTLSSFASINTLTDQTVKAATNIGDEKRHDLVRLSQEPAIARIVVRDENDDERIIYICRANPHGQPREKGAVLASYRAPIGRLAALPIGAEQEIILPNETRIFEVRERAALRPTPDSSGWDSRDTVVQRVGNKTVTVKSFRALLQPPVQTEEGLELLQALLEEGRRSALVLEGIQRSVIEKMGLRDRPTLDEFQDDILRLPINSRLIILGPPGTGKTTTLIKRLGQKLANEHLSKDEQALITRTAAGAANQSTSWIMFIPTELLGQYVKEAFAREDIPAPDARIRTWEDFRRDVARNELRILRTATRRGFVLREEATWIKRIAVEQQQDWYSDFDAWQAEEFWSELRDNAKFLQQQSDVAISKLGDRLAKVVNGARGALAASQLSALITLGNEATQILSETRNQIDGQLRRLFAEELKKDRTLLDALLQFVKQLEDAQDLPDDSEETDPEEDESEQRTPRGDREEAFDAYMRSVRAQARAAVNRRSIRPQSRNGKILTWLGSRSLPESERLRIGEALRIQTALRTFVNPLRHYLTGFQTRYRRFRRAKHAEEKWYLAENLEQGELAPLEVDLLMLSVFRSALALFRDRNIGARLSEAGFAPLETIRNLFRSQVMVDEATDFAPLQLACMWALCDPALSSFAACGDFNQRITDWGTRSLKDLTWALPGIDIRTINVDYRHSRQLNELARSLVAVSQTDSPAPELPLDVASEGPRPVLLKPANGAMLIDWLAKRIREIEKFSGKLPSIAVLVNTLEEVQPLTDSLRNALIESSINVVACPGGQAMGHDNDVRVFEVQYIKGLEFEAVFFVGVDELAARLPDLFEKYLYVGTTRAATYLGLTCSTPKMPDKLVTLEHLFGTSWA